MLLLKVEITQMKCIAKSRNRHNISLHCLLTTFPPRDLVREWKGEITDTLQDRGD